MVDQVYCLSKGQKNRMKTFKVDYPQNSFTGSKETRKVILVSSLKVMTILLNEKHLECSASSSVVVAVIYYKRWSPSISDLYDHTSYM